MNFNKFQFKNGFTLLELLITTSLIALMGLAIYSTFARGVMVWDRGCKTDIVSQEMRFTLQNLAKELRNSFKFSGIEFMGTKDGISFPTYVNTAEIGEAPKWEVGEVSYFYDKDASCVMRRALCVRCKAQDAKPIAQNIKNLKMSYYFFDAISKTYKWKNSWSDKENFPSGIRIALTIENEEEENGFVKTVYLPH